MNVTSLLVISALVVGVVACLSTAEGANQALMFDIRKMKHEKNVGAHKVKRAQEEVLFGNQQNKLTENHKLITPVKRDVQNIPMPDFPSNLQQDDNNYETPYEPVQLPVIYQPRYHDTYYYDPNLYEVPYYEEAREKRNIMDNKAHSFTRGSRAKRESQIDPEELIALLALWEAEQNRKHSEPSSKFASPYEDYQTVNDESNLNDLDEEQADEGNWLDGPVVPTHRIKPRYFPPYRWSSPSSNQQAKRYLKEIITKRSIKK